MAAGNPVSAPGGLTPVALPAFQDIGHIDRQQLIYRRPELGGALETVCQMTEGGICDVSTYSRFIVPGPTLKLSTPDGVPTTQLAIGDPVRQRALKIQILATGQISNWPANVHFAPYLYMNYGVVPATPPSQTTPDPQALFDSSLNDLTISNDS
ncbi:MAG TPA: hypothetical protein VKT80_13705, partial [Chloroflexota bacterium]|nr:hypothetical protein [Chloroflexota bacterium]